MDFKSKPIIKLNFASHKGKVIPGINLNLSPIIKPLLQKKGAKKDVCKKMQYFFNIFIETLFDIQQQLKNSLSNHRAGHLLQ
jgi:hypothetical protein